MVQHVSYVSSIHFTLPVICVDTVHELQTRGDLTPHSADSKRATKFSWLEKGKDPLSDQGSPPRYSSLRMSLYTVRERDCSSELLGIAGNSRGKGKRTRGE